MVWRYKLQFTDKTLTLRKCMYMRASWASELRKFWHFHILKLLFPSIFLLVLHLPCLRNIFNFRCQITSAYIQSMQFPFITYGMVLYKRQYTDKHKHWANVCVCEQWRHQDLKSGGGGKKGATIDYGGANLCAYIAHIASAKREPFFFELLGSDFFWGGKHVRGAHIASA